MPYDPAGNHSLVPSYKATPGQTIRTEQHNPPLEDISKCLSQNLVRDGRNSMVGALNMGGFPITNVGQGSSSTDIATIGQVKAASPVGAVIMFAGPYAPEKWAFLAGQQRPRTDDLFSVIGTTYGAGNGSTTYTLPDARGCAIFGIDNMGGVAANRVTSAGSGINGLLLGARGGSQNVTLTEAQMPSHKHEGKAVNNGGHAHGMGRGPNQGAYISAVLGANIRDYTIPTDMAGEHEHTLEINSKGGNQSHTNMPPALMLNFIIRVSS